MRLSTDRILTTHAGCLHRLPARVVCLGLAFLLGMGAIASGAQAQTLTRGPYVQLGTPTSIVVRWRTDLATDSEVQYGPSPGSLTETVVSPTGTTEHEVPLSGLVPGTR